MTNEREDYADPGPPVVPLPPARWLRYGVGLALAYATVLGGWAVANRFGHGPQDYGYWDAAGTWVYRAVAIALGFGVWLCWPLLRQTRQPYQMFFAAVAVVTYFVMLFLVNFVAYTNTRAPFP